MRKLLRVAGDNVAVDAGLDLGDLVARASQLVNKPMSLYTLPISGFTRDPNGSDVNVVDVPTIRRIVNERFLSDTPAALDAPPTSHPQLALPQPVVLDVVNATSRGGRQRHRIWPRSRPRRAGVGRSTTDSDDSE